MNIKCTFSTVLQQTADRTHTHHGLPAPSFRRRKSYDLTAVRPVPGNAANENLPERDPRGQGGKRPRWEQRTDGRTPVRPALSLSVELHRTCARFSPKQPKTLLLKCPLHTLLVCSARGLFKEANHLGLRSRPRQAHHARGPSDRDTAVGAGAKDSPLAHDDALSRGQTRPCEGARKDRQAARHADVTFPEGGARPARDCGQTTMKTTGARTSRQRGRRPGRARVRAPAHSAFRLLRAAPPA